MSDPKYGFLKIRPIRIRPNPAYRGHLHLYAKRVRLDCFYELWESAAPDRYILRIFLDYARRMLRVQAIIDYAGTQIEITGPSDHRLNVREHLLLKVFHAIIYEALYREAWKSNDHGKADLDPWKYVIYENTLEEVANSISSWSGFTAGHDALDLSTLLTQLQPLFG